MNEPRTILHADMDAFYASIEQHDDPSLRGRPVVIGGLGPRGVVSTASYEARTFGVHSAQPTAVARRLCPDAVYLPPRMERYVAVSGVVNEVFDDFTDLVEPLSLDEAFLDVTGSRRLFGEGEQIAQALRARVLERTGLTVSVGVAACKFVAKVASDLRKPDGLTLVPPGSERAFLAPLAVSRLWGVGKVTVERMHALGLATVGDVAERPLEALVAAFGDSAGRHYHALSHGLDDRPVIPVRPPKSISRETTFAHDLCDDDALRSVLLRLAEDVGQRLRRRELVASTVRLKLRFPPFETHTRQTRLEPPSADDMALYRAACALLDGARRPGAPVRLIGVGGADLAARGAPSQGELFAPRDGRAQRGAVDSVLDRVRQRFGNDAVRRAAAEAPLVDVDFDADDLEDLRPAR